MKWTLAYFDDQEQNLECYKEMLKDEFTVVCCLDSTEYLAVLENTRPHAFLLDVHMPKMDGFTLCRNILAHPRYKGSPIFFISGDVNDEKIISSFTHGAVDFIPRSMAPSELKVRIANKIKLYLQRSSFLEVGNLVVDVEALKAFIGEEQVDLTLIEMRILCAVMREFPKPISREEILKKIWGTEPIKPGTINTHVTNMKSKLEGWDHKMKIKESNVLIVRS